jgi:hypothetical protein
MPFRLSYIGLGLMLANAPSLFSGSPEVTNQGGPPVAKRIFTKAEIQSALLELGIPPNPKQSPTSCDIEDSTGAVVTKISPTQYPGGPFYWLHYNSGGVSSATVQFILKPMFTGSGQAGQVQFFTPNSNTNIATPFGIPFWFGNLNSGPWILVVHNSNDDTATCFFDVLQ